MKKTILAIAVTAIALTATTTFAADANSFNNAVSARDTALTQVQSANSNQAKAANALTAATRTATAATNAYTANPTDANYKAHIAATDAVRNKQLQQTVAMQGYASALQAAKAANAAVTGGALRGQVSAQQAAMPTAPANPTYNVPAAQPMKTPAQPVQAVQSAPAYTAPTAKTPTTSPAPSITGTSYRSYVVTTQAAALANPKAATPNGTIQKSVTAVPGNTQVTATVNGKTYTTTAAEVAKYDPTAQVSVPFHSAFNAPARNNRSHDGSNGSRNHSDGRGAENAHSHAFGGKGYGHDNSRTEGFGGHSHFH